MWEYTPADYSRTINGRNQQGGPIPKRSFLYKLRFSGFHVDLGSNMQPNKPFVFRDLNSLRSKHPVLGSLANLQKNAFHDPLVLVPAQAHEGVAPLHAVVVVQTVASAYLGISRRKTAPLRA